MSQAKLKHSKHPEHRESWRGNLLLKLLLLLGFAYSVYSVFVQKDFERLWDEFLNNTALFDAKYLVIALCLVPVNWVLEGLKWNTLLKPLVYVRRNTIIKAVLSGITISLITPNRIGEYVGRTAVTQSSNNWEVVISSLVGSICQLIVLFGFGLIGTIVLWHMSMEVPNYLSIFALTAFLATAVLVIYLFFHIDLLVVIIRRIGFLRKYKRMRRKITLIRKYSAKTLASALFLASCRYTTYVLQYYLLLLAFQLDLTSMEGFSGIATQYLLQTGIPLPPFLGLVARGELTLLVFGNFDLNELSILAASFSLWLMNLLLPALLGLIILLRNNILRSFGYGSQ